MLGFLIRITRVFPTHYPDHTTLYDPGFGIFEWDNRIGVGGIEGVPASITLTRIYPDPGTTVTLALSPAVASGTGSNLICNAYLIGYTVRP